METKRLSTEEDLNIFLEAGGGRHARVLPDLDCGEGVWTGSSGKSA